VAFSNSGARSTGLICAALGAFGFSFKAVLVKAAYRYGVDTETLLCLRMGYALPFFVAMAIAAQRRAPRRLTRRDWTELASLGVLGYYLSSYLDFLGLRYITAGLERVVLFIYPTLVVLLSAAFLGRPLAARTVVLLALSYLGVALSVSPELRAGTPDRLLGFALVLASALCYAVFLLRSGEGVARLGTAYVTAYATGIACLLCILQFVLTRPLIMLRQPWPVHALGAGMGLFSTVLPVWFLNEAMRRLGASTTSMIGSLGPVFTILLADLFLHEPIRAAQIAGAAIVALSVTSLSRASAQSQ
jgi:drug/metabolite transporter (DMT)-like permease